MPGSPPDRNPAHVSLGAGLAAVAGAVDVLAYTRLGHAFASVITGNVAVLGVAIGRADWVAAAHVAAAVAAYGVGVAGGSLLTRAAPSGDRPWPRRTTAVCTIELVGLLALAGVWIATRGTPHGGPQYSALALAALAMGLQSAAFRLVGLPGVTTTYFTGTLTELLAGLVTDRRLNVGALLALTALLVGATASGLLLEHTARYAALLPIAVLAAVVAAGLVGGVLRKSLGRNRPQPSG